MYLYIYIYISCLGSEKGPFDNMILSNGSVFRRAPECGESDHPLQTSRDLRYSEASQILQWKDPFLFRSLSLFSPSVPVLLLSGSTLYGGKTGATCSLERSGGDSCLEVAIHPPPASWIDVDLFECPCQTWLEDLGLNNGKEFMKSAVLLVPPASFFSIEFNRPWRGRWLGVLLTSKIPTPQKCNHDSFSRRSRHLRFHSSQLSL